MRHFIWKKYRKIFIFILRVVLAMIANVLIVSAMIIAQEPSLLQIFFMKNSPLKSVTFPVVILLFLGYFIRYLAAVIIVAIGVYYLVRKHKEVSEINFNTYIDTDLYSKFNVLSTGITPEERMYFQAQRNIEKKMKEEGNNYQVASSGAAVYSDSDEPKEEIPLPEPGSEADLNPEIAPDQPIASYKNDRLAGAPDPLADIPEFDPDGPDPFK